MAKQKHDGWTGWAWVRPGSPPILWFSWPETMVVGMLQDGPKPSDESAETMARVFGPGEWVPIRVVEVED